METIAGYQTTGRRLKGPASDLIELTGDRGQKLTAVSFHPEFRAHRGINSALEVVVRFLEDPMVPDLVEMVGRDEELGAFIYPTGQVWAVADVIRILADLGETAGVRAGLELMHRAGQVLTEAADYGASGNVYSHGGLTPWRLVMRQDGRVLVIGHALPQVEILMFHEDHTVVPPSDSFRYCPPERIHGEEEDLSSDLFSLCLIAFELMTGKPVYDGLVNDIRQKAARGEASQVLFQARERLPASVRDILANAMRLEMHDRYESGEDFLDAIATALSSGDATGPSLSDVMRNVSSQMQRRGVVPDSASTVMGTPEEIRAMLDDDEDEPASRAREAWAPPGSRAPARTEPSPDPSPAAPEAELGRGRRWSAAARRSGVRRKPRSSAAESAPAESLEAPLTPEVPADSDTDKPRWQSAAGRRSGVRRVRRGKADPPPAGEALAAEPSVEAASGVDIRKVLRSSRVRRPRRGRKAQEAPAEAPAAAPSEQLAAPPADAESIPDAAANARSSTADLLARIRQSASRSRASTVDGGSAAGALIEQLVRSSDRRAAGADPTPASAVSPEAPAREAAPRSRRVRRVRRAAASPPEPAVEETAPDSVAQPAIPIAGPPPPIASRDGGLPVASGPTPELAEADAADAPASDRAVPEPSDPSPQASSTAPDDSPTTDGPPAELPASTPAAEAEPAPTTAVAATGLQRPPAVVPTVAKSRGAVALMVRRTPTSKGQRVRFPKAATVAEAVGWIAVSLFPIRTDLTGRLTGWYRLHHDGAQVPPDTRLADLDPDLPLVVHTVPNELRMAEVVVEADPEIRFIAPVGTAVPAVSLIDHLTAWLELTASYSLEAQGAPLPSHGILADVIDAASDRVQLRLVRDSVS